MQRIILPAVVCALALLSFHVSADGASADEKAFLDKHLSEIVVVTPTRLSDAAVMKTISVPVFNVKVTINSTDGGSSSQDQLAARVDDKLVPVGRPSSDADCPMIQKMIKADWRLKSDDDAKVMQQAMDVLFPGFSDEDKKAESFQHSGHEWTFIRGKFFEKHLGFVLTTDGEGKVTAVKFSLSLK